MTISKVRASEKIRDSKAQELFDYLVRVFSHTMEKLISPDFDNGRAIKKRKKSNRGSMERAPKAH